MILTTHTFGDGQNETVKQCRKKRHSIDTENEIGLFSKENKKKKKTFELSIFFFFLRVSH